MFSFISFLTFSTCLPFFLGTASSPAPCLLQNCFGSKRAILFICFRYNVYRSNLPFLVYIPVCFHKHIHMWSTTTIKTENISIPAKLPCALWKSIPSPQPASGNHGCVFFLYGFAFPRMSCKWNSTACSLWRLLLSLGMGFLNLSTLDIGAGSFCCGVRPMQGGMFSNILSSTR